MSDNTMPSELWIEYRRGYGGVSERNIDGMTAYIRADVCAERQNAVQREVHVERMRADGLRKQLDAANKRNVALSGELAFMRDDRNLYYAMAKRQTSAIEEFNARIAELEAAQCANSEIVGLIAQWAFTDGSHHRQWLLDQILRVAAGDSYETVVSRLHEWDEGVPP